MSGQQIIDEIADDRVGFIAEFGDYATDQRAAATMPFQVDRAVEIACAVNFRPAVWPARLLRPNFDEVEFLLQLRIAHDL